MGNAAPVLYFEDAPVDGIITPSAASGTLPATSAIYNISGQRVNITRPGLYIVNGKKVVVK